nr:putative pheromone receptor [Pseudozyma thailandica]
MYTTIPITVLSILGAALVTTLIPSYYRARNVPVLLSVFWLLLSCLCITMNTAGWQGSSSNKWQAFCEFSIRIVYASTFALQCCSSLLLSRLEAIAATRYVSLTESAKKRRMAFELVVGLCLPILFMALAIISQGHRYDIIEDFGPVISIYPTALSIVFSTLPVLFASVVSVGYAILCSYWLFLRRRQLSAVLSSSGSGVSISQYARLFGLSCVELAYTVPITWTVQMQNLFSRYGTGSILYPYTSWASVHAGFSLIGQSSIAELQQSPVGKKDLRILYLGLISVSVSCFLFFGFLGTSTKISKDLASRCRAVFRHIKSSPKEVGKNKRQSSLTSSLSPPLSSNDELTMKHMDDFKSEDFQIEVLVERTHYVEPVTRSIAL